MSTLLTGRSALLAGRVDHVDRVSSSEYSFSDVSLQIRYRLSPFFFKYLFQSSPLQMYLLKMCFLDSPFADSWLQKLIVPEPHFLIVLVR